MHVRPSCGSAECKDSFSGDDPFLQIISILLYVLLLLFKIYFDDTDSDINDMGYAIWYLSF